MIPTVFASTRAMNVLSLPLDVSFQRPKISEARKLIQLDNLSR